MSLVEVVRPICAMTKRWTALPSSYSRAAKTVNVKDQPLRRQRAPLPVSQTTPFACSSRRGDQGGIDIAMKGGCGFRWDVRAVGPRGTRHVARNPRPLFAEFAEPNFSPRPSFDAWSRPVNWAENRIRLLRLPSLEIEEGRCQRSKPWVMRTYSGHSSAVASNSSTVRTSPRARPVSRLPSICRPRLVMTRRPAAAGGRQVACRSRLGPTCPTFEGFRARRDNT